MQKLLCSTCKEVKGFYRFSKMQREQGDAACCQQCVHKDLEANSIPQMLLCLTCKEVKKLDCFSKKRLNQGEVACCKQCINKDEEAQALMRHAAVGPQMLPTAERTQFLGEYMLHKCVNIWHDKDFALGSFYVFGTADTSLIWSGMIFDLGSFIRRHARRCAVSMMKRSGFKELIKSAQLAKEWAIGAANELLVNVSELARASFHEESVRSFCTKHIQFKYIDNMQTSQRIAHTYTRVVRQIRNIEKEQKASGKTSNA